VLIAWPPCFFGFFLWGFVTDWVSFHICLQTLSSELELLPQLRKWQQRCYVDCGKDLTAGGTSVTLPMKVTFNHNDLR
jgi:hypothetical protein